MRPANRRPQSQRRAPGQGRGRGTQGVGISIDGFGAIHDELRGVPGSFELALAALRHVRATAWSPPSTPRSTRARCRSCASSWTSSSMPERPTGSSRSPTAMGNAADHPELLLQPWQMLELMPLLAELSLEGRERGLFLQPANNIGYYGPYESTIRNVIEDEIHWHGCNAGDTVFGIEADGTIKSCPGLPSPYAGGNVRDKRLREIWENAEPLAFVRRRTVDDLWGFCRTCYYAETCMAGCTWTAHALLGRAGNNPMCHHRALEMDKGPARAAGQGQGRRRPSFDHGEFEIVVEPAAAPRAAGPIASPSMAEQGRVPPRLRLCRGCRQFVRRTRRIAPSAAATSTCSRPIMTNASPICIRPRRSCARRWPVQASRMVRGSVLRPTTINIATWAGATSPPARSDPSGNR